MEKQKRWQLFVIVAVILLTVYNILPTVFFYSKPLKDPINQELATTISSDISKRVNNLEEEAQEWVYSFAKNLGLKDVLVSFKQEDPRYIQVKLKNQDDAALFKRFLPRAGLLLPFVPSQLELASNVNESPEVVTLQRRIAVHLPEKNSGQYFSFIEKRKDAEITEGYKHLLFDRLDPLLISIGGPSSEALSIEEIKESAKDRSSDLIALDLASKIAVFDKTFKNHKELKKRYYASFTQVDSSNKTLLINDLQNAFENTKTRLIEQKNALEKEQEVAKEQAGFADASKASEIKLLSTQIDNLTIAQEIVKKNKDLFNKGRTPLNQKTALALLEESFNQQEKSSKRQFINLEGLNPFISSLTLDWNNDLVTIELYPDVKEIRALQGSTDTLNFIAEKTNQLLFNEIASISREISEPILPLNNDFSLNLNKLNDSTSILTLNLSELARVQANQVKTGLTNYFNPESQDLQRKNYNIYNFNEFTSLSKEDSKLGLVVYVPSNESTDIPKGFKSSSIYVIARGLKSLSDQYIVNPTAKASESFIHDFNHLREYLGSLGFFGYPASSYSFAPEFKNDYIFELDDYYNYLLKATRESFNVYGNKKFAQLEMSDLEQRILSTNRIEDRIHEDLLKWKDAYHAAQVDLNLKAKYDVPPPTHSAFFSNLALSFKKYFRGDDRKILKWGLDLSGGKTVRIGLKDQNGKAVDNPEELNEAVNELFKRVNKLGVSEVGIRVEGKNVILDFPGSQGLSASELVKASSMTFHVVNEKFGPLNKTLAKATSDFLQEVWNEAVVTNKKSIEDINTIAWQHLGGSLDPNQEFIPQSESARILYENGLRLASSNFDAPSATFNDTLSAIAMFSGDDFAQWQGQSNPLLVVFRNYALEGTRLENVQAGYDPSKGNILSFSISGNAVNNLGQKYNARDELYAWTSQFAQEKIVGTPKEEYSSGRGYRMAVILNGTVVSSPSLNSPLRDHAMMSGHFSQREINQLAADLKAGSLSFTPKILSEQNVSPELGASERAHGIFAAVLATIIVIVSMCTYYRFAGLVASIAVLFLLLIMWGVLQNIGAALTLPGIAGIILTIGMAIDANVLVYERIREEFKISRRLPSAVQAGYRKAFAAIIDSNLTSIIAAIILLQFDSGPIKGFALTLIIGIIASMFTSLFVTRFFFAGWVQNPKNKELKMSSLISATNFNFLKFARPAILLSIVLIAIGALSFISEKNTLFGMDFTGGFSLNVDLPEKNSLNYKEEVAKAFIASGAKDQDFQIRELNTPHNLRIQLGTTMEQPGHPFFGLPLNVEPQEIVYQYEVNPRLTWVIESLRNSGIELSSSELSIVDQNWSEMSGQLSDAMRNNAIIALIAALLAILIYITLRFEFKYGISAVIGLAHDVLITVAFIALLHLFGSSIQIDLQVIAAIMTIIGYSLNDTIIIFDRIREDLRVFRKLEFKDIVNGALNKTLSRTLMTSGTTILVLLALTLFGGHSIFNFSLVMTIGVVVGTLSSLFVAAPLLIYFHNKEVASEKTRIGGSIAKASSN